MKFVMTFNTIMALIILVVITWTMVSSLRRKKKLGELEYQTFTGLRYSNFYMQFFMILILCMLIYFSLKNPATGDYSVYVLIASVVIFTVLSLMEAFAPKGIYENGIYTSNGPVLYSDVHVYETHTGNNSTQFQFNNSAKTFIELPQYKAQEVRVLLKKHCKFAKGSIKAKKRSN